MDWRHRILLCLGVLGLIKAAWGIVAPKSMQKVTKWWIKAASQVNTLIGIAALLLAAGLWVLVLWNQDLVNWLLVIMGVFFAWAATAYFRKDDFQKFAKGLIIDRTIPFVRTVSVIGALLFAAIIWAAVFK
ncbi:MAG: hypothetical protein QGI24_01570 [Kiritimatiellia bacterium]|nr:hypothetical protein [Kiritimatiellia bacterium]